MEAVIGFGLLDDMGCQVAVEAFKLTIVMNDKKTESTKSYLEFVPNPQAVDFTASQAISKGA